MPTESVRGDVVDINESIGRWPWHRKAQAERGVRGWSYAEVARRLGEDRESARRWLLGQNEPREGVVQRLALMLGWPLDLFTNENVPFVFDMHRHNDDAWIKSSLKALDVNGRKVVAALSDPIISEYLAGVLDQYRATHQRIRDAGRRDRPPAPRAG